MKKDVVSENILNAIEIMIDARLKDLNYEVKKDGVIIDAIENRPGFYSVGVAGNTYTLKAVSWRTFKKGDVCMVRLPGNSMSKAYIM